MVKGISAFNTRAPGLNTADARIVVDERYRTGTAASAALGEWLRRPAGAARLLVDAPADRHGRARD